VTTIQDVDLTVISRDVYDCTHTYRFAIRLEPGSSTNNQPPVAKIQYKVGSLSNFENAPTTPVTVQTDIARTITLKGDTSTDDGGTANLAYTWVKVDSITGGGVTLSSNSGATTTLQVLAHTNGTVNVTLTAKDKGNLTGTATISFNIADPAKKPTARATVKVGNQALTGVVSEGTVVTLDGSASSRQDNTSTGLTYQWTQTEGPIVTITDANKAVATFTAPAATETASQLKFKLIVTDGGTPSDPVEVTVSLAGQSFYFSQVAVGPLGASEFRTVLMLVNQNTTPATGVEVKFFGQDGNSMPVTINDEPWDSAPFDIPALGSKRLVFSGQDLKAGWAQVNSSVKITGLLRYQVVGDTENLETEVGLYSTEAARKFATFFDRAEETAIAVANPNAQPAKVRIRLIDDKTPTGDEVVSKYLFVGLPNSSLPAMNHRAQFVDHELLGTLPSDFSMGTLIIESDVPVTITVVRTRGGVVFSTLPVASMK